MRDLLRKVTPQFAKDRYHGLRRTEVCRRLRLAHDARRLLRRAEAAAGRPGGLCEALWEFDEFRPLQIRSEIVALLGIVEELRPRTVCEIGAANGGTTFLFARAAASDALLISLDLGFDEARARAVSSFAGAEQQLVCLRRDSHDAQTRRAVESHLEGRRLDFLFIDGDHGYEGVGRDFEMYGPLVRPGGLIAFHDIVPLREGDTNHDVGGVPEFWREMKGRYHSTSEIVEDREQSAFGIGVLRWT